MPSISWLSPGSIVEVMMTEEGLLSSKYRAKVLSVVGKKAEVEHEAFNEEGSEEALVAEARQQTHFIETVRGMASVKLLDLRERRGGAWMNHFVTALDARLRLQRLELAPRARQALRLLPHRRLPAARQLGAHATERTQQRLELVDHLRERRRRGARRAAGDDAARVVAG